MPSIPTRAIALDILSDLRHIHGRHADQTETLRRPLSAKLPDRVPVRRVAESRTRSPSESESRAVSGLLEEGPVGAALPWSGRDSNMEVLHSLKIIGRSSPLSCLPLYIVVGTKSSSSSRPPGPHTRPRSG